MIKIGIGILIGIAIIFILYTLFLPYLIKQAKHPKGMIGKKITSIWSTYFNTLSHWTLQLLDIKNDSVVLDVGFGGGVNIKNIKEQYPKTTIYGIDISKEALITATNLNQLSIDKKEVFLSIGNVMDITFPDHFFSMILATQTHIYWDSLEIGLKECYRILQPSGQLVISCEIDKIQYHLPKYTNHLLFKELLEHAGFNAINVFQSTNHIAFICYK